jgi:hypothetical protein
MEMSGMEGICPKCGIHYYGWVLKSLGNQTCEQCGANLEIFRDGVPFIIDDYATVFPNHDTELRHIEESNWQYPDLLNLWRLITSEGELV